MIYRDLLDTNVLEKYAAALNSRAHNAGAPGRLSERQLRDRILESAGRCEWCGSNLVEAEFELDHIVSLNQRGANTATNLVVACPDCNRRKGQKHPARFAAEIFSESGHRTRLIHSIFRHYDVQPAQQLALFEDNNAEGAAFVESDIESLPLPPYRWTE